MSESSPIVLGDFERHVVFYSKGFFLRTNTIHDLKMIHSRFFVIEYKFIRHMHLYEQLLDLFMLVRSPRQQRVFWGSIFGWVGRETVTMLGLIEQMLGQIAICQVHDSDCTLIELGEPDYTVLPKRSV